MLTKSTQFFIMFNIYILLIVNCVILFAIYVRIIKVRINEHRYHRVKSELYEAVQKQLHSPFITIDLKSKIKSKYRKMIMIDILTGISEKENKDLSKMINQLELDLFLIERLKLRQNLKYLRKLALMKGSESYPTFFKYAISPDIDVQYICFFGLSLLQKIEKEKKYKVAKEVIKSELFIDRIIEILSNMDLTIEDWLLLLESEESEHGIIIYLKIIADLEEIKNLNYSNKILNYLNEEKEVRIAAITALCNSKNEIYIEKLYELYQNDEVWEVRAAIARGMANFVVYAIKDKLLEMLKDSMWWVRFNAARAISLMGEEGLYTLIDLSVDNTDEQVAALAYYFLNANNDIHETIRKMGG